MWIDLDTLHLLHQLQVQRFGGLQGVRDAGVIESTLMKPQNRWHYEDDLDMADLAATYFAGFAQQQGFLDGNKRTALYSTLTFLHANGFDLEAPLDEVFAVTIAAARNQLTTDQVARWLRPRLVTRRE